jgi:ribA/ribD-fused uncharacterized protein
MIVNNEHAYVSFIGRLAFCSNFYYSPLTFRHIVYPTAEHAYQATKMVRQRDRDEVARQLTPYMAKQRARAGMMHPEWDGVKLAVMHAILRAKFDTYAMHRKLVATGTEELVEHNTWGDTYWGMCRGMGQNHLGRLLMQVRTERELLGAPDQKKPKRGRPRKHDEARSA